MTESDRAVALLPGSLRSWGLGAWHHVEVLARFRRVVLLADDAVSGVTCALARVRLTDGTELDVAAERLEGGDEAPLEADEAAPHCAGPT